MTAQSTLQDHVAGLDRAKFYSVQLRCEQHRGVRMHRKQRIGHAATFILAFVLLTGQLQAAMTQESPSAVEILYGPDNRILAYEVAGGGVAPGFETVILHNIAIFNTSANTVRLTRVTIDATADGKILGSLNLGPEELDRIAAVWAKRQASGRLATHELLYQIAGLVRGRLMASSTTLEHDSGLIVARTPMLINSKANHIIVSAEAVAQDGTAIRSQFQIPVIRYKSKNTFRFPLCGRWMIAAGPNINAHHRWGAPQEFALDLAKFGPDMRSHKGDGSRREMFYAYGAPVRAVADGTVVGAENGLPDQDLRHPDESEEEYQKRLTGLQEALIASGFRAGIGNYVVVRHAGGEYSLYAHLKADSLRVKDGDQLSQGSVIAALGHSGNSTEPHLHFSIQDGPDPLTSRSLPFQFDGLKFWDESDGGTRILNSGQVVEANC